MIANRVSAETASRVSVDKAIADADLDELLRMVRGAPLGQAPDYGLGKARQRLLTSLRAAHSSYRAKARKRPWGTRQRELRAVANQAHLLRTAYHGLASAYGALDPASLAALFQTIRDEDAHVPSMLLDNAENASIADARDDGNELFVTPVQPRLNLPALAEIASASGDLAAIERCAEAAAALPAPKGRPKNEADFEAVRILAGFVDWCGRPHDERGGAFPSTVSVTGQEDGPFHQFVIQVFRVAIGIDDPSASTPLLRTIRNVVDERKATRATREATRQVGAHPNTHLLPDPDLEDFGDVPRKFRTRT